MQTARFLHGSAYTIFGLLLLMYLGGMLINTIWVILIFAAIGITGYGLYLMGVYQLAAEYMQKVQKPKTKQSTEQTQSSSQSKQSSESKGSSSKGKSKSSQ